MFEIGTALRDARTQRGLDLAQCEVRTRIRAKYLRAMEDERFELLPAAAYVKGFLRSYGESLGLDGQVLVDEYTLRFEPRPEPVPAAHELAPAGAALRTGRIWPKGRGPRSFRRSEAQLLWLAIGGAIAVGLLVWIGADDGQRATPIPVPLRVQTAPATTPQAPPVTAAGIPAATAGGAARPVTLSATGVDGTNGSYLQVRRGGPNGPVVFENTIPAGSTKTFHDGKRLWIRVGWTPGITLQVGGRRAATAVGTLNFLVTPRGLRPA